MSDETNPRIPNLLHLVLFFVITFFAGVLSQLILLAVTHRHQTSADTEGEIVQFAMYLVALAAASVVFPPLWHQSFFSGIGWNARRVRPVLVLAGLALGFAMQGIEAFLPHPKDLPIEQLFRNPATIWLLAFFGVVVGPLFEEVVFRGFLLPALAHAIDWLRLQRDLDLERTLDNLDRWRASSFNSTGALVVSSVITSVLFALLHAPQIGWTWPAIAALFVVSLVLCVVRIRTQSLAASTLVHGCYNLSIFVTLFAATGGFEHLDKV